MGEQQRRPMFPQQVGRLAGQLAVGDANSRDDFGDDLTPKGSSLDSYLSTSAHRAEKLYTFVFTTCFYRVCLLKRQHGRHEPACRNGIARRVGEVKRTQAVKRGVLQIR